MKLDEIDQDLIRRVETEAAVTGANVHDFNMARHGYTSVVKWYQECPTDERAFHVRYRHRILELMVSGLKFGAAKTRAGMEVKL